MYKVSDLAKKYKEKLITADQAAAMVKNGDKLHFGLGCGSIVDIDKAIAKRADELKDINPDNLDLIEDYLSYMKGTGKADTTLTVYRSNLNIFFVWCKNYCKNKDFSEIKKNDYLKFQTYMVSENLSPARIRNVRATLSSLSNYIETMLDEEEKWANFRNIILKIEAPKMAKVRDNTILTDEQCQNFLDLLIQQKK